MNSLPRWPVPRSTLLCWIVFGTIAPLLLMGSSCGSDPGRTVSVGLHRVRVAGHELEVEIAADPGRRETGLMYRTTLAENGGMLFVFPQPKPQGFWMKNCFIDLDIAYLDDEGKIVDLLRMTCLPSDFSGRPPSYRSSQSVRYALETNAGWFEAHGIEAGAKVEGLELPRNIRVQ